MASKKVYTITFQHVLNYGAVLQAYALSKFLNNNGFDVNVIDYRPRYFMYQTYRPRKGLGKSLNKFRKNIRFYKFRKQHLPLTRKIYFNIASLKKGFNNSNDDFVCGSDQLWNAQLTNNQIDGGYFLDFLPRAARRISYAASIGNTAFKKQDATRIHEILKQYSSLSVREDFAQSEVKKISDNELEPTIVVDPTLLLDDYSEILDYSLVPDMPYLVSYLTEDSQAVRGYIKEVMKRTGLPLINLGHHEIKWADKNYLYESPSKWLGVFSKATIVCTNSFHGNAYSLIFKRNFTVFSRDKKKELNRRQLTLLENLGIQDRFIYKVKDLNEVHLTDINYVEVTKKYDALVKKSKDFLINALNE